ncbi:Phasin [Hasllibacter halocynthiae]|nr:Phasin [Hasllibacter halocynthiae]
MNNANDMQKMLADMLGAFPMDTSAMQDAWKTQAQLAEKMSRVALDAAETSTEISAGWTKRALAKMNEVAAVKDEPADYGKAMTDFASATAEMTAETMAQFAEVAKKVQMETVELMLAAGREGAQDGAAATTSATGAADAAAQKTAAAVRKPATVK